LSTSEPIDYADWLTAKALRNSISTLEDRHDPKYDLNIKQERKILKVFFDKFAVAS
jgi:hypothetical protein